MLEEGIMYKYDRDFFQEINTEEKAYFAGFIAADGNIRKDFLKMRIELNIKDKEILEKFKTVLGSDLTIKEHFRPNNHSCYLDLNSKKICTDLSKIGIIPNKSLILDINFDLIPQELTRHFIRGYFDGDGSINCYTRQNKNYKEWELSFIGTEKFLCKIQEKMNITHKLYTCGNNWRFGIKKKQTISEIIDFLYQDATVYLERKKEKAQLFKALNDYQAATLK
jgi:hypothetical protein